MKTKIKILVMTAALTLFMSGNATAQGMPTYDNTNFISLVKRIMHLGRISYVQRLVLKIKQKHYSFE